MSVSCESVNICEVNVCVWCRGEYLRGEYLCPEYLRGENLCLVQKWLSVPGVEVGGLQVVTPPRSTPPELMILLSCKSNLSYWLDIGAPPPGFPSRLETIKYRGFFPYLDNNTESSPWFLSFSRHFLLNSATHQGFLPSCDNNTYVPQGFLPMDSTACGIKPVFIGKLSHCFRFPFCQQFYIGNV